MPKIVDHDVQRVTFAEAAMRLIARHGIEGVTMRAVAAEAGALFKPGRTGTNVMDLAFAVVG